jgi:hypothetical protein
MDEILLKSMKEKMRRHDISWVKILAERSGKAESSVRASFDPHNQRSNPHIIKTAISYIKELQQNEMTLKKEAETVINNH